MKPYKILVTAGNTQIPIDKVRSISNIFKGKTGNFIAYYFGLNSHKYEVTLLTSSPQEADALNNVYAKVNIKQFKTYDELASLMEHEVRTGKYDMIIHSAAVSDYKVANVMVESGGTGSSLIAIDSSKKVSSDYETMFLKLVKTKKLLKAIRSEWNFKGRLIGFKLLVGTSDEELISVAQKSLITNEADAIVANTLEESKVKAFVVMKDNVMTVKREEIAMTIEKLI